MGELRALVTELRPARLEEDGLVATLRHDAEVLGRVHATAVTLTVAGDPALDDAHELAAYRVAQEALHNALQHSRAAAIRLGLAAHDGWVEISVADDGVGFDPQAPGLRARRLGLTSMRERARGAGGTLVIDAAPGRGTIVRLRLPAQTPGARR